MIELMILGFLDEKPQHGFELRRQIEHLHSHARPISDGSLYPAINRLLERGLISGRMESGTRAANRRVLEITETGQERLHQLLRDASGPDITDLSRFIVVLAFLSLLPDRSSQLEVLKRRLDFLDQPDSFFYEGDRPQYQRDVVDPYRRGIFTIAKATSSAERAWLQQMIEATRREE